jgi:hypothetical protein
MCLCSAVRAVRLCDNITEVQRIKLVQKVKILISGSAFFEFYSGISTVWTGSFVVALLICPGRHQDIALNYFYSFLLTYCETGNSSDCKQCVVLVIIYIIIAAYIIYMLQFSYDNLYQQTVS